MKKFETILREYAARLSPDSIKSVLARLEQRIGGDLAEAIECMSDCQDLDKWLSSAKSADDLYDMIDTVQEFLTREYNRRVPEVYEN